MLTSALAPHGPDWVKQRNLVAANALPLCDLRFCRRLLLIDKPLLAEKSSAWNRIANVENQFEQCVRLLPGRFLA